LGKAVWDAIDHRVFIKLDNSVQRQKPEKDGFFGRAPEKHGEA
jgi:hypothetical protein